MTAVLPTRAPLVAAPLVDPGLFGVYVHVPFCLTRCHYCDFVTYTGMEGLRRPYAAALLERQKEGKRRMKQIGRVEVPQEAFVAALRTDEG